MSSKSRPPRPGDAESREWVHKLEEWPLRLFDFLRLPIGLLPIYFAFRTVASLTGRQLDVVWAFVYAAVLMVLVVGLTAAVVRRHRDSSIHHRQVVGLQIAGVTHLIGVLKDNDNDNLSLGESGRGTNDA